MNLDPRLWKAPIQALVLPWSRAENMRGNTVMVLDAPHMSDVYERQSAESTGRFLVCTVDDGTPTLAPDCAWVVEASALVVMDGDPDRKRRESWRHLGRTKTKSASV